MRGCVNSKTRMAIAAALVAAGLAGTALAAPAAAATNFPSSRTLGIEGRVSLELRSGDYRPRPMDDRAELILRIEDIHSASNQPPRYDFRYLGFEAGDYALADFLMRPDGSRPEELSNVLIHVQSMLPADHDGKLTRYAPRRFPFMGGYRAFLALLSLLWVLGLCGYVLSRRKKRVVVAPVAAAPEPTFAERIRPLVEAAAGGNLSVDGKAQLERLLMGFWREKLNLPDVRMAEALAELKAHAQAGELLRALERWLHQRTGATAAEVQALLAPYRRPDGGAA